MITIEQLLESVDLGFEPLWVTRNNNGVVQIWAKEPFKNQNDCWDNAYMRASFGLLKLSDFDGKDWTECIYKVPRKVDYTKWIGKLCWFWDSNSNKQLGILTGINDSDEYRFIKNRSEFWIHCEPVRPDDDVIYKGE